MSDNRWQYSTTFNEARTLVSFDVPAELPPGWSWLEPAGISGASLGTTIVEAQLTDGGSGGATVTIMKSPISVTMGSTSWSDLDLPGTKYETIQINGKDAVLMFIDDSEVFGGSTEAAPTPTMLGWVQGDSGYWWQPAGHTSFDTLKVLVAAMPYFQPDAATTPTAAGQPGVTDRPRFANATELRELGLVLRPGDGGQLIVAVDPEASSSDVSPGDVLVAMDGQAVINMSVDEMTQRAQGAPGTLLALKLRNAEQGEHVVQVVRGKNRHSDLGLAGDPESAELPPVRMLQGADAASAEELSRAGFAGKLVNVYQGQSEGSKVFLIDPASGQTSELWRMPELTMSAGTVDGSGSQLVYQQWGGTSEDQSTIVRRPLAADSAPQTLVMVPADTAHFAGVMAPSGSTGIAYGVARAGAAPGDGGTFEVHVREPDLPGGADAAAGQDRIVWQAAISDPRTQGMPSSGESSISYELTGWDPTAQRVLVSREEWHPTSETSGIGTATRHLIDTITGEEISQSQVLDPHTVASPDGRWVVARNAPALTLIRLATGESRTMTGEQSGIANHVIWSPDSRWFAWSENNDDNNLTAVRVRPSAQDGAGLDITDLDQLGEPLAIDPSGTWLLVGHYMPDESSLWQKLTVHDLHGIAPPLTLPWVPADSRSNALNLRWIP